MHKFRRKSQSAMEYLMTYGWSILIIAVVLGALFQLGVFNSANFAPRAQPGNCHVFKGGTQTALEGVCGGELPQYVLSLSGASYVDVPTSPGFNVQAITVSAWVKASAQTNYVSIVDRFGSSWSSTGSWSFHSNDPTTVNKARWAVSNSGPSPPFVTTSSVTFDGTWHFVTAAYDGTTLSIYQDGVLQTSTTSSGLSLSSSYDINIGRRNTGTQYFIGSIGNVQVYNASLSANEIQALYLEGIGGAPVLPTNIIGWWPLNGDTTDYSGNSNNGQNNGASFTSAWTSGYTIP